MEPRNEFERWFLQCFPRPSLLGLDANGDYAHAMVSALRDAWWAGRDSGWAGGCRWGRKAGEETGEEDRLAQNDEYTRVHRAAEQALAAYRSVFGSSCWNEKDRLAFVRLERVLLENRPEAWAEIMDGRGK